MINSVRSASYKHGYLILTAAWLYTLSFIVSNYWSYNASPEKVQNKLEQQIQKKETAFTEIISDTTQLSALVNDSTDNNAKKALTKESFGFFVFEVTAAEKPMLVYWNSNQFYTDPEDIQRKDGSYFLNHQNGSFELIKKTIKLKNKSLLIVGLLPVKWDYFIENKYLVSDFEGNPGLDDEYVISSDSTAFHIHRADGSDLFKIKLKEGKYNASYDIATLFFRSLAIVFLFFFFNSVATDLSADRGFRKTFIQLVVLTLLLRLISYEFPLPFNFSRIPLFDPSIYATDFLHRSLGDLLINSILVFWLLNFYKFHCPQTDKIAADQKNKIFAYLHIVLMVFICFLFVGIIRSLVLDSKISFDVTNFFSLSIYSVISFGVLGLLVLSFYNLSHILLEKVFALGISIAHQLLIVSVTGLIFLSFKIGVSSTIPNIVVLIWLLLFFIVLNLRKGDIHIPLLQSSFFIFWVMFFATSVSAVVIYENKSVEIEQRKRIAERLALQADPSGESLLNIAATNFSDKFLADNFHRFKSEYSNKYIKDSLIDQNFSGYLNKYDTRIYTFDHLRQPLYNDDSTKYATLKTLTLSQGKLTGIPGLFSYENVNGSSGYLYEKVINTDSADNYLFVMVKPKKYVSEALFPELFKQTQDVSSDLNTDYSYAVYSNGKIINKFNEYNFPIQLNKRDLFPSEFLEKDAAGYNELWYNSRNGKQVLIVKRNDLFLEWVALFAYLFCVFLAVIFLFRAGNYFLQARFKWPAIKQLMQLNIRSQIHATIIFISIFSFVVIGIATISFFIIRFNKSNEERLLKSLQVMTSEVESRFRSQFITPKLLNVNDADLNNSIEKAITEISETHAVDVNFFDINGTLKVSTQPYIYNKHLLSDKMEPIAYWDLSKNNKTRLVQNERIGKLSFLSIYAPVTDEEGNAYGYLNIPYLNSQAELNQEISGFLAALINLNAFTFLMAGAIAFLITNRITSSFSLIGDKMKQVSFGKVNEVIDWKGNDEIGVLVNEYNKMVKKLEESAKALAQSEREGAWREMARQVAHEIKNPLTPMKLSIQYLQKAIDGGADNVKELSQNVAKTLVEQIDQLSKIAGDFSQFANISNVRLESFDLSELLVSLFNLYQTHTNINMQLEKQEGNYFIIADKGQINRLFTNLIKNAIEATEEVANPVIVVKQELANGRIKVSVTDNAKGIAQEMKQKIFTPNFTTKSSGTGLGLAICKGIVEKANGHIGFETEEHIGTTFLVELPSA